MPSPQTVVIENIVEDVLATYVEEMDTLLSRLEVAAMSLESDSDFDGAFGEVRRILHSIKGDSGMCGVTDVQNVCHELESELDELQRKGSLADHVFAAFREGCEAYVVKADMGDKLLDAVVQLGLLKVVKVQKDYVID